MNENVGKVFNLIGGQSQTGGVPPTRKVNGKPLSSDIVLTASDVGAAESGHSHTAADVGARPTSWTPSAADVGAVPVVRKVNGKVLSADVTLNASDVGAASSGHIHTAAEVGALPIGGGTLTGDLRIKGSGNYGTKINLGDGDYVHFAEPIDDCLEIKAKKINFVTSDSTDQKFTLNGDPIGGGSSVTPATTTPKVAGTAAVGTSAKYAREDHVHPSQTSVTGNAGTATKLQTSRSIDGVSFNGAAAIVHYGVCSTPAGTAAKAVSCSGFSLVAGAKISVKFTYADTSGAPTLNVNGTGAKSIVSYGGLQFYGNGWTSGQVVDFIYDGTNFAILSGTLPYFSGTYTGDGAEKKKVVLPFHPRFLIISGMSSLTNPNPDELLSNMQYIYVGGEDMVTYQLEFDDDGFNVYSDPNRVRCPILNASGRKYYYIAFR